MGIKKEKCESDLEKMYTNYPSENIYRGVCECPEGKVLDYRVFKSEPPAVGGEYYCKTQQEDKRPQQDDRHINPSSAAHYAATLLILILIYYLIANFKIVKSGGKKRSYRK